MSADDCPTTSALAGRQKREKGGMSVHFSLTSEGS